MGTAARHRIGFSALIVTLAIGLGARAAAQDTTAPLDANAFFSDQSMQELRLQIHRDDWARLQAYYLDNTYYPADVTWRGLRVRNVGIRSRGNGSRNQQKPGFRIDIDRFVTDQRFLRLKSFVVDNVTQDDSLIKERVAMRLFERLGLPAPREAHARVYVNDEFMGVYVIVESIDKDFIERTMTRPGPVEGTAVSERDGVLFEYRWHYPFYFAYLGPELEKYSELFEPKTHEDDSPDRLYRPLEEMCRFITESSDEDFMVVVGGYLDLREWVRYVAAENFVSEKDGMLGDWGVNNFYLYRLEQQNIAKVIAWDKDNAFNRAEMPIWAGMVDNVLMRRAMAVPELRELYLNTLLEAASLASTPVGIAPDGESAPAWLESEIDRAVNQIAYWVRLDTVKPQSNEAFDSEVERLRRFARQRSAFVQCEVANARNLDGPAQPCTLPVEATPASTR
jgi:spore coat protein CotH